MLELSVLLGLVAWFVVVLVRIQRSKARWESGAAPPTTRTGPEPRSLRVFGGVFLAFGVLIALTYSFWVAPADRTIPDARYNGRGVVTSLGFIVAGLVFFWIARKRSKRSS